MRDHSTNSDSGGVTLAFQALLYASGEMEVADTADFEARLEADQTARDALCQAVQMTYPQAALGTLKPNPAYRDRVRQRLQPRNGFWRWFTGRRFYHGHPLVWSILGAAAALVVMLSLPQGGSGEPRDSGTALHQPENPTKEQPSKKSPSSLPRKKAATTLRKVPAGPTTSSAEAVAWAELRNSMAWRKRFVSTRGMKH
jgi:hypothetical protein